MKRIRIIYRHGGLLAMLACLTLFLGACSVLDTKKETQLATGIGLHSILPQAEMMQMSQPGKVRYFTDNVYLAAQTTGNTRDSHLKAAEAVARSLRESLSSGEFVTFWVGVDAEFFGRVNAVLEYEDYTHPQLVLDERRVRTAYNLGARHLDVLPFLGEMRREAMRDFVALAAHGEVAACFAFHKAYKEYAKPLQGETGVDWPEVEGKPFRKSMWAGSAEAGYQGRLIQIALPPQVVLGCRRLSAASASVTIGTGVTAGMMEEVEQYFAAINLRKGFDADGYGKRKEAWQQDLRDRALTAAGQLRLDKIHIVNVIDVYRIFPPEVDHEYESAVANNTLPEYIASGLLSEERAFEIEQRVVERQTLLTGAGITPAGTPLAYLQRVADKIKLKKQ